MVKVRAGRCAQAEWLDRKRAAAAATDSVVVATAAGRRRDEEREATELEQKTETGQNEAPPQVLRVEVAC